ncbi:MAG TPA: DinB family protein [Chloroflexia bacterium]|nr:DinB family protein [Chloroflexia bacterium]
MPQPDQTDQTVLTIMFQHHTWATQALLDACAALSAEQIAATATGAYGSIQDTLHHLVGAEVSYVHRVTGQWPDPSLGMTRHEFPGVAVLREVAGWTGAQLLQLALTARAGDRVREYSDDRTVVVDYRLASLLMQAIDHATEHRTHVATILTQLGLEPPDMAGWKWMEDTGDFREYANPDLPAAPPAAPLA